MDNEIIKRDIEYKTGVVTFNNFEHYMEQANEIAEYISGIELTKDNMAQAKKDLAAAKKVTKQLDQVRIRIKKDMLKPYEMLENQIKQLNGVINKADSELRSKVKEMEEEEREAKKEAIKEIFDKRIVMYDIDKYIQDPFQRFIKPQHLNKTMSMNKVEKEMTSWMEEIQSAIDVILKMDNVDDVMVKYVTALDLTHAIECVNEEKALRDSINEARAEEDEPVRTFIVTGKANIELTERLLKENGINYKTK